jgi:NADH-quinone oxidoreductase subunit H
MSAMTSILFLGGWLAPFGVAPFTWIPGVIWFVLKICFVLFFFLWVRATFPRYRYDQLMRLGWKVFLPLSLLWLVITAGALMAFGWLPNQSSVASGQFSEQVVVAAAATPFPPCAKEPV